MTMRIVTGEEMRHIDRRTIEERGIPGRDLMESAGKAVVNLIMTRIHPRHVALVTGKGNNAGDGFVVARLLHKAGLEVKLLLLAEEEELSGDALASFLALPHEIPRFTCHTREQIPSFLNEADSIVDALLGTGVKGEVKGLYADVITAMNRSPGCVVSVDIPSGLPADAPYFDGLCVHADFTVAMGLPKLGMVQYPARGFCGEIIVDSLLFPDDLLSSPMSSRCSLITSELVRALLPPRPPDGHKGTFGSVLIVAGSPGMTGAASMTALASARSGTGLVYVAIPQSLNPILEVKLTEPLTIPLPTDVEGIPDMRMYEGIMEKAKFVDAIAVGPGMGRAPQTQELIRKLFITIEKPLVLDADGINAFEDRPELLKKRTGPGILTPHPGELSRLVHIPPSEIQKNRLEAARKYASEFQLILVLKGAATVIAEPGGEVFVNSSGNTALSKGGSGDVLTGLIAGFLAQGASSLSAAILGVFLQGLSGEIASREKTERAALPGDVIESIPLAFKQLIGDSRTKGIR